MNDGAFSLFFDGSNSKTNMRQRGYRRSNEMKRMNVIAKHQTITKSHSQETLIVGSNHSNKEEKRKQESMKQIRSNAASNQIEMKTTQTNSARIGTYGKKAVNMTDANGMNRTQSRNISISNPFRRTNGKSRTSIDITRDEARNIIIYKPVKSKEYTIANNVTFLCVVFFFRLFCFFSIFYFYFFFFCFVCFSDRNI